MDKQTSKKIDEAVSSIKVSIYKAAQSITDDVLREIETRLIQTIHDRWEYIDKQKNK
jgi:hypothetical protein